MSQTARIIPLYREADQSNPRSFFLKAGGIICLLFSALFMSPVNIIKTPNNKVQQSANFFLVDFVKDSFDVSPSGWYEDSLFFVADGRTHKAYEDAGSFKVESYDPVITQDTVEYDVIPNITLDVEVVVRPPVKEVAGPEIPANLLSTNDERDKVRNYNRPNGVGGIKEWGSLTKEEQLQEKLDYIKRYKLIAQAEQKKYGIPASVTLAQGIWETAAENSDLSFVHKNHFGIKCFDHKGKKGNTDHCVNKCDDSCKDRFKVYTSAWQSFRDRSIKLQGSRYKNGANKGNKTGGWIKCGSKDYKCWVKAIAAGGWATDKRYAGKLIQTIEDLELYKYDK